MKNYSRSFRTMQYLLQAVARDVLGPEWRVSHCLRDPVPSRPEGPAVMYSAERARARYGGLMVCKSRWTCPVCSVSYMARRQEEIELGLMGREKDFAFYHATFTVQHHLGDPLADLLDVLKEGIRRARRVRKRDSDRAILRTDHPDYVGAITVTEIRYSLVSGWHPHNHTLFIFRRALGWRAVKRALNGYLTFLEHRGFDVNERTLSVDEVKSASDYLTKMFRELTMNYYKRGRGDVKSLSPFQMLHRIFQGDDSFVPLFQEYAYATKGLSLLRFSRGLKEELGLDLVDAEAAAADLRPDDYLLARLSAEDWRLVMGRNVDEDRRGQLLDVVKDGDVSRLEEFLEILRETRKKK